jgi:hypothetical protein
VKKKLRRNGIRGGLYTFTTQATCTHKPFDALAVDAWATLAAELGNFDWRLAERCRRSFEDLMTERTAGISQIATAFIVTDFVEGAKMAGRGLWNLWSSGW